MSLFRRKLPAAHSIPVVPDDKAEREAALKKSEEGLANAVSRIPHVIELSSSIANHYETNHYAQRLQTAYGRIQP